ncbi:MAG: PIN domain-containing protein [Pseudonocardia sp.]|nr:PIN domain-containing protein [Pseudonocardia sp.]
MTLSPVPGRLYLVDTSAQARAQHPAVREVLIGLIADRAVATCVTVDLEAGYSGRDAAQVHAIGEQRRSVYVTLPINEAIAERAREVQRSMATRGHHRAAGVLDLITAAVAEYHDATVLHYDADFEHIAATTHQPHRWVVPRGSVS